MNIKHFVHDVYRLHRYRSNTRKQKNVVLRVETKEVLQFGLSGGLWFLALSAAAGIQPDVVLSSSISTACERSSSESHGRHTVAVTVAERRHLSVRFLLDSGLVHSSSSPGPWSRRRAPETPSYNEIQRSMPRKSRSLKNEGRTNLIAGELNQKSRT